jgi:hypothetical protein
MGVEGDAKQLTSLKTPASLLKNVPTRFSVRLSDTCSRTFSAHTASLTLVITIEKAKE